MIDRQFAEKNERGGVVLTGTGHARSARRRIAAESLCVAAQRLTQFGRGWECPHSGTSLSSLGEDTDKVSVFLPERNRAVKQTSDVPDGGARAATLERLMFVVVAVATIMVVSREATAQVPSRAPLPVITQPPDGGRAGPPGSGRVARPRPNVEGKSPVREAPRRGSGQVPPRSGGKPTAGSAHERESRPR